MRATTTGTHLCGYYVCENIHKIVNERANSKFNKEVFKQYSQIYFVTIRQLRFQAIGEELAGFFIREVLPPSGEYHFVS